MTRTRIPLLVDVVMERLFTFLDREDLRQCRLVCRLWCREADRALANRHSRTITTQQDLFITLHLLQRKEYTISKLTIDNNNDLPFLARINISTETFMNLFQQVAPTLLYLSIQYVQCTQEFYLKIMRLFAKYDWLRGLELGTLKVSEEIYVKLFPVKKEESDDFLVFTRCRFLEYMDYSTYRHNVGNVTCLASTVGRMFPNLQQMNIFCLAREKPSNFNSIKFPKLKSLRLVMHPQDAPFQFHTGLTNIGIKCLMNMGLALQSFDLYNIVPQCTMLRDFLESTAESLLHLTLIQSLMLAQPFPGLSSRLSNEILPSPFPTNLPNLKSLHITKSFFRNLNDLLVSTPALETLYLDFEYGQKLGPFLPPKLEPPPSTLKEIGFSWIEPRCFIQLTTASFANQLTSLVLTDSTDTHVEIVCTHFHNLKQLVLAEKSIANGTKPMTDAPFTGMDIKAMKKLHHHWFKKDLQKGQIPKMTRQRMDELETLRKSPGIASLQNLEVLILRFIQPSKIQYWIFWPFWELESLSTVIVSGIQMSKDVIRFMYNGGGYICTGPYTALVKDMWRAGLRMKFYDDGNAEEYSFVRPINPENVDEEERPIVKCTNELYDALSAVGTAASIVFSETIVPMQLKTSK